MLLHVVDVPSVICLGACTPERTSTRPASAWVLAVCMRVVQTQSTAQRSVESNWPKRKFSLLLPFFINLSMLEHARIWYPDKLNFPEPFQECIWMAILVYIIPISHNYYPWLILKKIAIVRMGQPNWVVIAKLVLTPTGESDISSLAKRNWMERRSPLPPKRTKRNWKSWRRSRRCGSEWEKETCLIVLFDVLVVV